MCYTKNKYRTQKRGIEVKIGIVSDIHLDVNADFPVLDTLVSICNQKKLDKLIIAGDISSDYTDVLYTIKNIKEKTNTQLHFVPGNHDLFACHGKSSKRIYKDLSMLPECLITHPIAFGDWVIVGDVGWYDYSFKDDCFTYEEVKKKMYKGIVNSDKRCFQWGAKDDEINEFFIRVKAEDSYL